MKLIKCHIENFGKLSDFTYDFTDGCNTVCEGNGWGKSTLAAFLRVMLFGFRNEGKRDPLENERKRYSPWQKGVYGGELQFESEGKQYSVRRTFGSKSAEDEFQLTDTKTNLPCSDFTQNLGEESTQDPLNERFLSHRMTARPLLRTASMPKSGIWRRIRTISIILRQRTSG